MKIEPTVAAIATAEEVKAQPSWSLLANRAANTTAITASTCTGPGTSAELLRESVQATKPSTSAIAAQPSGRAAPRARSRSSPVVRSFRKAARCSRHSPSSVTPVHRP